jgi:hypothetical protein
MPETGEWFSPRTRPEMLTSDDPPIQNEKPELVQILPGPATVVGRATAPLRRLVGFVPSIGRRIVRVDDEPSRWQLVGMWTSGSAIVAATGLAIAAVLGGAPPALTQPFERLAVLPGIVGPHTQSDEAPPSSSEAKPAPRHQASDTSRHASGSSSYGYSGGSSGGSSPSAVYYPEDLVPGRPAVLGVASAGAPLTGGHTSTGTTTGGQTGGNPAPPAGGGTTAPAPDPTTAPPPVTDPTEGPTDPGTPPTDPGPPTEDPTDPAPPTEEPTDPAPPVDPPPADPTPESPPDTPPNDPPANDPTPADPTQDQPVDPPAPTPETPPATP